MKEKELVKLLVEGKLKWYEIEEKVSGDSAKATEIRRRAVEELTGVTLKHVGK